MKKGFTLIELLAVIVVLAIIALIAVPVILNVIEKAKEGSAVDSAYGYIHAIEHGVAMREIQDKVVVPNGEYEDLREYETANKIGIKGTKPTRGTFTLEKRQVVYAEFIIDGYLIICDRRYCRSSGKDAVAIITYESNGGTLSKEFDMIKKGTSLTLPVPEKDHHGFDGWYTESNGNGEKVTNETVFNDNVTLYANYIKNKYTVALENAKFSDGETTKALSYGDEVVLTAIIPANYTESSFSGNTTCSSTNDSGKTRYKIKHEYSLENWNVEDTTNSTITYTVKGGNQLVKANIVDTTSEVEKYRCDSTGAGYQGAYYSCSKGSLSGSSCVYSYAASCSYGPYCTGYTCGHGGSNDCQWESGLDCESCSCPNGGTLGYNSTCSTTTSATYHGAYYYCSSGWSLSGSTCYKWTGI